MFCCPRFEILKFGEKGPHAFISHCTLQITLPVVPENMRLEYPFLWETFLSPQEGASLEIYSSGLFRNLNFPSNERSQAVSQSSEGRDRDVALYPQCLVSTWRYACRGYPVSISGMNFNTLNAQYISTKC